MKNQFIGYSAADRYIYVCLCSIFSTFQIAQYYYTQKLNSTSTALSLIPEFRERLIARVFSVISEEVTLPVDVQLQPLNYFDKNIKDVTNYSLQKVIDCAAEWIDALPRKMEKQKKTYLP